MKYEPHQVIVKALTTEKSLNLREHHHCYAFQVATGANKLQISRAVEELFKVKVVDVRTLVGRGKMKKMGRFAGRRPAHKKAYVTIAPEGHIELFEKA
ncbi:MAG: 50S ribosomal protein L23 [candidate division Zixibacteria bacterium]|nr:50S ribosomal protein L23 [candidate division Zixibacteria bacterium]